MSNGKFRSAKEVSIIAITAALFAVFFFLSYTVALPNFTFLYLPIILLGVFPLWFGWSGLVGSMAGALIGGVYVEGLYFNAWIEVTTAVVIYMLNWVLISRKVSGLRTTRSVALLGGIYALTLAAGTACILGQYVMLGLFTAEAAMLYFLPTFALNAIIVTATCPTLIRTLTPRMENWGICSGSLKEWHNSSKVIKTKN